MAEYKWPGGEPWPRERDALEALQRLLSSLDLPLYEPSPVPRLVGGVFVCFERGGTGPGNAGDRGWAGAALMRRCQGGQQEGVEKGVRLAGLDLAGKGRQTPAYAKVCAVAVAGEAGATYSPGHLALREGQLLQVAVGALPEFPEVLLVNSTGLDHPRRAGLAVHLGAVLGIPTVGVTHRPLFASGESPGPEAGDASPLFLDRQLVGYWLRTARRARPVAVHAAFRTEPDTALAVVRALSGPARTPDPIRCAREAARTLREQYRREPSRQ